MYLSPPPRFAIRGWTGVLLVAVGCGGGAEEAAPPPDAPITVSNVGFATPESVLHDLDNDVYLVSNINGDPLAADDNGFISRLSPTGTVEDLKWIDGADDDVTLNAPKGLAVLGDVLYVTDVTTVRMFDRNTGAAMGDVPIDGATFLNDVTVGTDGWIYITDSGFTEGFQPSGTDAVYRLGQDGEVESVASGPEMGRPNGVVDVDGQIWVVTFGSGQLYRLADGAAQDVATLPTGSLDGLVVAGDGSLLVSSWEGQSVLRGTPGGSFAPIVTDVEAPADIGLDRARGRILIPLFQANEVRIVPLP